MQAATWHITNPQNFNNMENFSLSNWATKSAQKNFNIAMYTWNLVDYFLLPRFLELSDRKVRDITIAQLIEILSFDNFVLSEAKYRFRVSSSLTDNCELNEAQWLKYTIKSARANSRMTPITRNWIMKGEIERKKSGSLKRRGSIWGRLMASRLWLVRNKWEVTSLRNWAT